MFNSNYQKLCGIVVSVSLLGFFLLYLFPYPLPDPKAVVLADRNGYILAGESYQSYQYAEELPSDLIQKILSIEDPRFYRHLGVDPIATMRAISVNIRAGKIVEGASTIDQQLIKVQHQAYQRSWHIKFFEIISALRLNMGTSKEQILLAYANVLPFPYGYYGLKAGCVLYFGISCEQLSDSQQYFLIASYQLGANGFSPGGFTQIKQRSQLLCERLGGVCGTLLEQSPVGISDLAQRDSSRIPHHMTNWYLQQLARGYKPPEALQKNDGLIRLPVDFELYERIEYIIDITASQRAGIAADDCCVVIMDDRGELLSMNSCRPWDDLESGQFNSCLSKRQTGSAIKPFLYVWAMHVLGLTATDTILDEPVVYRLDGGALYTPQNFDLSHHGEVSLATALGSSLNIPAVKLLDQAGAGGFVPFLSMLRTIGGDDLESIERDAEQFSLDRQGLSLALGTYEMTPYEFTKLWRVFIDVGLLREYDEELSQVATILSEARWRVLSFGQDNILNLPDWIAKTGTSRHFVDGWTCGAHPQMKRIICVWMGNHNASPMRASGIQTAGYLWRLVAEQIVS